MPFRKLSNYLSLKIQQTKIRQENQKHFFHNYYYYLVNTSHFRSVSWILLFTKSNTQAITQLNNDVPV
ncbi:unnamed protein product [Trichobilharzia szidati]|nr:unnamed protein product [Trichobilharzia szidati]